MTVIRCPLNNTAEQLPDSPALISSKRTVTFSELEELVHHTALILKKRGLERHSHIAIVGKNSIEYCILILAALRIGAIICPINDRWPKKIIKEAFDSLECNCIIKSEDSGKIETGSIESVDISEIVQSDLEHDFAHTHPVVPLDNPATMIFTSGSTSQPRAALLSYGNLYTNAKGANKVLPFNEKHRWLLSLPLYHVGGIGVLFRAIIGGGAVAIPDIGETLIEAVIKYNITHVSLVPTQLYRMVNDKSFKILKSRLNVVIGGGPVSEDLVDRARKAGLKVFTTYGLTEMASQVTTDKCLNGIHSGKLLSGREMKIADDGEVLIKGDTLFLGYVENGEAVLMLDEDGWFQTGDLGRVDADGYFHFIGRKDNMLISGGENIYPEEIEKSLLKLKEIEKAIVVAIPDDEYGQRPVAFIKCYGDRKPSDSDIIERLKKMLPKFKVPQVYLDWPESESNDSLKPSRKKLAMLAEKSCSNSPKRTPKVSS